MSEPSFSILVPTYNQAEYLGACLDSIARQTDPDWRRSSSMTAPPTEPRSWRTAMRGAIRVSAWFTRGMAESPVLLTKACGMHAGAGYTGSPQTIYLIRANLKSTAMRSENFPAASFFSRISACSGNRPKNRATMACGGRCRNASCRSQRCSFRTTSAASRSASSERRGNRLAFLMSRCATRRTTTCGCVS